MNGHRWLDKAPEYTFALAALVAPPLAVLVPYGMAVELPILGVISGLLLWWQGELRLVPRVPLAFMALFSLWAGISLLWAPDPGHGATTLVRMGGLSISGILALALAGQDRLGRRWPITLGLAIGIGVAALLLAIEVLPGHRLSAWVAMVRGVQPFPDWAKSQLTRGGAVTGLLLWPLAVLTWRRRSPMLGLLISAALLVQVCGDNLAANVASLFGAVTALAVWLAPRWGLRGLRLILIAGVVVLPRLVGLLPEPPASLVSLHGLPSSAHHRLLIWHYTVQRMADHPWRGWGMDAARADPGGTDMVYFDDKDEDGVIHMAVVGAKMPLHPHNTILQWWMELGFAGAMLLAAFLWWLVVRIEHGTGLDRVGKAGTAATLMVGLTISCVSYGAWQSWWVGSLWLAAAFCLMTGRAEGNGAP